MIFGFLTKFSILVYFFRIKNKKIRNRKKSWKSIEKIFFEIFLETKNFHWKINIKCSWKIEFFSEKFSIFHENCILIFQWTFLVSKKISKNMFSMFFKIFSISKKIFVVRKNILKSEIWSGIQKSYLEHRASIIKLFKIKIPIFLTQILGFPYSVTYTDPKPYFPQPASCANRRCECRRHPQSPINWALKNLIL